MLKKLPNDIDLYKLGPTLEERLHWARKEVAFCNQGFIYRYIARRWSIRELWFLFIAAGIIIHASQTTQS